MMVPASGYFCAILGESLEEFLHLGSIHGYFCLEQFAYSCDSTLEYTGTGRNVLEVEDRDDSDRVLELLRSKFQLRPWTDRGRYAVLQEKYQPLLQEPIEKI